MRPPPLPVVTATAERRGAGAGAGTPCERLRSRSPRPSAPDARSRTASAHARTSGEGGGRPGAARRPRPYVGPVQDSARARARIASRERLSLPLGAAGKKKGPSWGGGRWSKFRTRLRLQVDPEKARVAQAARLGDGRTGEETLGNDHAGALCVRSGASVALPLEEEQNKVEPLGHVTPQCVALQFRALPSAAPALADTTSGATRF